MGDDVHGLFQGGVASFVKSRFLFRHVARRNHARGLTIRPEAQKQRPTADRATQRVVARLAIGPFDIRQEADAEGVFENFFELAGLNVLQVKMHIDEVEIHGEKE